MLFNESPEQQIYDDLRRLKQVLETGEVAPLRRQPRRRRARSGSVPRNRSAPTRAESRSTDERANCWHGKKDMRVEHVPDPKILNQRDAIVKITSTAICGSDLHLYNGFIPTMEKGDILGHEFMGEVVEVGPRVKNLKVGDRVVVPFPIACGTLRACERRAVLALRELEPECVDGGEADGPFARRGIFGYSHMLGGYAGGQAEYARVPFADVGPLKIPDGLSDEQVLFLSDIFPTGYMGAEMCNIKPGDTIAVWGCGPVGQFAIASAKHARRRARDRDRSLSRAARDGAREGGRDRHDQLRRSRRLRHADGDDRRRRSGCVHRRGRHRSAHCRGRSTPTTASSRR